MSASLQFWFEFASTYSYLSAMRIQRIATAAEVTIEWKPFLLGPIFAAQGWTDSPFNIYPVKGRYMWRDMERLRRQTEQAMQLGIFGAPSFVVDGELFWGNDRLPDAVRWASGPRAT